MINKIKILCLADNTSAEAWGHKLTEKFAQENNVIFRGAITNSCQELEDGCYHVGPISMQQKDIIDISKKFDRVVLIDQPQEKYSHFHLFTAMFKLVKHLKQSNIFVEFENKNNFELIEYWDNLLQENKSFCIFPWIYSGGYGGYHTACMVRYDQLTEIGKIKDWAKDENFLKIRNEMLTGKKNESNCSACYRNENLESGSIRYNETLEWVTRLKLKSIEELKYISSPKYYEIRPNNKCNIRCRTCVPNFSHLIDNEYKSINEESFKKLVEKKTWNEMTDFNIINFKNLERLYVAGGEPTISHELYKFLRKCVDNNNVNFDFRINTNAVKISEPLFKIFKNFPNLGFSVSLDGIPKINEYIRWGTNSKKQIKNIHSLKSQGHQIAFISVVSIYNVDTLGELMTFIDNEFPYAVLQLQFAGYKNNLLSAYNHPNKDLVIASLELAKKTLCYYNNERNTKNIIDSLYDFYLKSHNIDLEKLKNFFIYNDRLDLSRGSKLRDYIPELEECRKYIE